MVRSRSTSSPAVTLGRAEVTGHLDSEIIRRVIRRHRRGMQACYERQLRSDPTIEGRLVVRFTITPDGDVAIAIITENDTSDSDLGDCVLAELRRMTFPESDTSIEVTYPFLFQPED